jgi:hypothetical protein
MAVTNVIAKGRDVNVAVAATTSGATAVVATPGANRKLRVKAIAFTQDAAGNIKFQSATNDKTGLFYAAAAGQTVLPYNPSGWFDTNANEALNINLSAIINVGGQLTYEVIDV